MKREEKNQLTLRRILDSALIEFSNKGYGASSINAICSKPGLSKGIIYHYFETKEVLYLACVNECFEKLTKYLKSNIPLEVESVEKQLEIYFKIRMNFFEENEVYQPIFCEAVLTPPIHLKEEILDRKKSFDELNVYILENLLKQLPLRSNMTILDVMETFQEFQDFINAKYQVSGWSPQDFKIRDKNCQRALSILLYGVIDRKKEHEYG